MKTHRIMFAFGLISSVGVSACSAADTDEGFGDGVQTNQSLCPVGECEPPEPPEPPPCTTCACNGMYEYRSCDSDRVCVDACPWPMYVQSGRCYNPKVCKVGLIAPPNQCPSADFPYRKCTGYGYCWCSRYP
jgi:hypothetical protein